VFGDGDDRPENMGINVGRSPGYKNAALIAGVNAQAIENGLRRFIELKKEANGPTINASLPEPPPEAG